jgi:uncharacterized membrane protein YqaE (UPF0057 family)
MSECKTDSDCPSGICQMMFTKNENGDSIPDTRKCVDKLKKKNTKETIDLKFGKLCNSNSDCSSGICIPEVTIKNGIKQTGNNKCVIQKKKLGKQCNFNYQCDSNICETQYDIDNKPQGSRCIIIENEPQPNVSNRDFLKPNENDVPDFMKTPSWKEASQGTLILSEKQKDKLLEGRGPITEIIVLVIEMIITLIKQASEILFNTIVIGIFKYIFLLVSWPFLSLIEKRVFIFSDKYKCKDKKKCDGHCDSEKSYSISHKTILSIITILFPPYGVFLHKGITGYHEILLTSVLTILFYFPGMLYGLSVIKK